MDGLSIALEMATREDEMGALPFFSTAWRRYLWFIVLGLGEGAVAHFVISGSLGARYHGDLGIFVPLALCGGLISAVVFGILLRLPQGLRAAGFLVVGILTPWLGFVGAGMLSCRCFDMHLDPRAAFAILVWTLFSLPFSILSAVVYLSVWLLLRIHA